MSTPTAPTGPLSNAEMKHVLQKARDAIAEYGLVKGDLGGPSIGYCSRGAILLVGLGTFEAAFEAPLHQVETHFMAANGLAANGLVFSGWGDADAIVNWNNHPERTHADALEGFDKAIAALD